MSASCDPKLGFYIILPYLRGQLNAEAVIASIKCASPM